MEQRILVDGVVYFPFTPQTEQELEDAVIEHSELIFGKSSFFLPKKRLKTPAGIGSIPDGFVLDFKKGCWYVVEVELASHDLYSHIVPQLSKFFKATSDKGKRLDLVDSFDKYFDAHPLADAKLHLLLGNKPRYKSIKNVVVEKTPIVVVVIDRTTDELSEVLSLLPYDAIPLEFRTFVRQNVGDMRVHLHLIETLGTAPKVTRKRKIVEEVATVDNTVLKEPQNLSRCPDNIKKLYREILNWYRDAFDDVAFNYARDYTGLAVRFHSGGKKYNIAELHPKQKWIRFHIRLRYDSISSPPSFAEKVGWFSWWKDGDTLVRISSKEQLGELFRLLGLAHEQIVRRYGDSAKAIEKTGKPSVRGKIISQKEYYIPILEALVELGGSGKVREVLDIIHRKMKDRFSPLDLEPVPSGKDIRWESTVKWARNWLREQGYISSDSPWGVWEITDKGREYLKSKNR